MRRYALLFALVGCFAPDAQVGAPCGNNGECPSTLKCSPATNTCELMAKPGEEIVDAAIDAREIDARPDAPPCMGTMTFNYSGAIVMHSLASCATSVRIEAWGAEGGNGDATYSGGKGAYIAGTLALTGGTQLRILVGERGKNGTNTSDQRGGTGGGGSFVVMGTNTALVVAGGGGGGTGGSFDVANGGPGQITTAGQIGGGSITPGAAGTNGGGGGTHPNTGGYHSGTGAGGLTGDGLADSDGGSNFGTANTRGKAFVNGGAGGMAGSMGRPGGFGGGGAAGFTAGGGGGYSGGGGASNTMPAGSYAGGGGGSFNGGMNKTETIGVQSGNGKVTLTWQ